MTATNKVCVVNFSGKPLPNRRVRFLISTYFGIDTIVDTITNDEGQMVFSHNWKESIYVLIDGINYGNVKLADLKTIRINEWPYNGSVKMIIGN
jgi:hypothetical protein